MILEHDSFGCVYDVWVYAGTREIISGPPQIIPNENVAAESQPA